MCGGKEREKLWFWLVERTMGNMEDEEGAKKVVGEKTKKVRGALEEKGHKYLGTYPGGEFWKVL